MTHSSEHILHVVQFALHQIFILGNAVIVPTIDALRTGSTRKKHTEVASLFGVKVVRFRVSGVNLGQTASQRDYPLVTLSFVSGVLVIPNVIIGGAALLIRDVFSTLPHLFACRPLHPLMHLVFLQFLHFIHFTLLFLLWTIFFYFIFMSFLVAFLLPLCCFLKEFLLFVAKVLGIEFFKGLFLHGFDSLLLFLEGFDRVCLVNKCKFSLGGVRQFPNGLACLLIVKIVCLVGGVKMFLKNESCIIRFTSTFTLFHHWFRDKRLYKLLTSLEIIIIKFGLFSILKGVE